uniref:DNA repair protein RecO n=1 Tax=Cyanophora paradoxa TaxID=2762 RepID=A0A097PBJ8_CYAPA|nr:hypothetical protein [Cyanophora paradoxa]
MLFASNVIILKKKQRDSNSIICTLYTYEEGLKEVIIFTNQKFLCSNLKLYRIYFVVFKKGTPWDRIHLFYPLYSYSRVEQSPLKITILEYLSELIIYQLYSPENSNFIYFIFHSTLFQLNICSNNMIFPIFIRSLYLLLQFLGWEPELYNCVYTGESFNNNKKSNWSNSKIGFSASYGGIIKSNVLPKQEYIGFFNKDELLFLQTIINQPIWWNCNFDDILPKKFNHMLIHIEFLFCQFIEYQIQKRLNSSIKLNRMFREFIDYMEQLNKHKDDLF